MRFLILGVMVLLLSACLDEPDCIVTASNLVKISLQKAEFDSVVVDTVAFSEISVSGTDALFYTDAKVTSLSLPLNTEADTTTIIFYYGANTDSLTLGYVRRPVIVSPDCGAFIYYENVILLSTSITIVKVTNPQLSTSVPNNLEIKF